MSTPPCTACQSVAVEPGFLEDRGQGSQGYGRWIAGPLETGIFGSAKKFGSSASPVLGFRCSTCGHLDLYVDRPGDAASS